MRKITAYIRARELAKNLKRNYYHPERSTLKSKNYWEYSSQNTEQKYNTLMAIKLNSTFSEFPKEFIPYCDECDAQILGDYYLTIGQDPEIGGPSISPICPQCVKNLCKLIQE